MIWSDETEQNESNKKCESTNCVFLISLLRERFRESHSVELSVLSFLNKLGEIYTAYITPKGLSYHQNHTFEHYVAIMSFSEGLLSFKNVREYTD